MKYSIKEIWPIRVKFLLVTKGFNKKNGSFLQTEKKTFKIGKMTIKTKNPRLYVIPEIVRNFSFRKTLSLALIFVEKCFTI